MTLNAAQTLALRCFRAGLSSRLREREILAVHVGVERCLHRRITFEEMLDTPEAISKHQKPLSNDANEDREAAEPNDLRAEQRKRADIAIERYHRLKRQKSTDHDCQVADQRNGMRKHRKPQVVVALPLLESRDSGMQANDAA